MTEAQFYDIKVFTKGKVENMLHMAKKVRTLLNVDYMAIFIPDYGEWEYKVFSKVRY